MQEEVKDLENNINCDYSGLSLTPGLFTEILIKLFDGKQFKRQDAINEVLSFFIAHGGIKENRDYIPAFKRTCVNLRDKGITNRGYGVWSLSYKVKEIEINATTNNETINLQADYDLGSGQFSIYLYYYNAYKELAEYKNKNIWECKIGRTDCNPIQRVFGQAGTCYPESPHLALLIHCDNSIKLESAIHSILKYKERWMQNAPGSEWFMTSPEEVIDIYNSLSN